jgi:hypothetical protein
MSEGFDAKLVALCGLNCATCIAFFGYTMSGKKRKAACKGCRTRPSLCVFIKKGCKMLANKEQVEYCFECSDFPCETLVKLEETYVKEYGLSLVGNLKYIEANGIDAFLKNEQEKWKCPTCSGVTCIHTKKCYTCNPT